VGADEAERREKAGVGDAPNADPAVVVGNVFDQPIDGVVGVRALIHVFRAAQRVLAHGNIHEDAFGEIPAANILIDEDEALSRERTRLLNPDIS
jgi:hypothetical protein